MGQLTNLANNKMIKAIIRADKDFVDDENINDLKIKGNLVIERLDDVNDEVTLKVMIKSETSNEILVDVGTVALKKYYKLEIDGVLMLSNVDIN